MVYLPGEEGDYEIKSWGDKKFAIINNEKLKEFDEEVGCGRKFGEGIFGLDWGAGGDIFWVDQGFW